MRKYAISLILCTLFLFNTNIFAAGDTSLQAINIQNSRVQKIYQNFSNKLNARIVAKSGNLSIEANDELGSISRDIESDFLKIDEYVRTQDRTNGIATVSHINTLIVRIQIILSTGKPTASYTSNVQTANIVSTPASGKSEANSVEQTVTNVLYYADNFEGAGTSGGNKFSQKYFSSANCDAPLHTMIQVISGGKSVLVKNNDRPNCKVHPDIVDLSTISFQSLAPLSRGKLAGGFVQLNDIGKAYIKQYIPTDFFAPLDVVLDANIPNAYLTNETFHISGQVTDAKDSVILFFVLPSGKQFNIGGQVTDDRFSFSVPLSEVGKYRLVIASGQGFETTQFFELNVFDPGVFSGKKLFDGLFTPIDTLKITRSSFRDLRAMNIIDFPGDAWREVTISQDNHVVKASGIGDIAFWSDALKDFKISETVHVTVTAARSSTNFSHDTYTTPAVIFDKDMKLAESWGEERNEKLDVSLTDGDIHIRGFLNNGVKVANEIYVTLPNGTVESYNFDSQFVQDNGNLLRNDGVIDQKIPSAEDGLYIIEVNYDNGFAAINIPLLKGNILPLGTNPEDRVVIKEFQHLTIAVAQDSSLSQVNAFRKSVGSPTLTLDSTLSKLAMIKAQDMANNNYVGHADSKGVHILGTAKNNNIVIQGAIGENVAGGNTHLDILITGLMMSGGHRKNMLDTTWTKVGIGYVEKDGKIYYSQLFGE